jgi:hypothetical protein
VSPEHRVDHGTQVEGGASDYSVKHLISVMLWIGAAVWTARIVWEETVLSWREGPQMIGFSFLHGVGVLFLLCWAAAHLLMVGVLLRVLWSRAMEPHHRKRLAVLGLCFVPVTVPLWIPGAAYLRVVFAVWGPGRYARKHLIDAAALGELGLVKYLLSAGAAADAEGHDMSSALNAAAIGGSAPVIEYLLKEGADPNRRGGTSGRPPLMDAAEMNRVDAVKALLRGGADPALQDGHGETALGIAVRLHHTEVVDLLRGAQGNPEKAADGGR